MIGIVAVAKNDVMGMGNAMPWRCPDDLKFFKEQTLGKTILMGRKTYESIGRMLPGRVTKVLTRDAKEDFHITELPMVLEDTYLCGGAEIYKAYADKCDAFIVTHLDIEVEGDTYFPSEVLSRFKKQKTLQLGESNGIKYQIIKYSG